MKTSNIIILIIVIAVSTGIIFTDDTETDSLTNTEENIFDLKPYYISFTFDDGYLNQYENGYSVIKKNNINGTLYVITGHIDGYFEETRLMSLENIQEMEQSGWEIGSHTVNHPFLTRTDNLEYELVKSKKYLEKNGIDPKGISIPFGDYNNIVIEKTKKHYDYIRTSDWGINNLSSLDRYRLKSRYMFNDTTIDEMKTWVDQVKKSKGWLIIMVHHVSNNQSKEYTITPEDLSELIVYIKDQNIETKTVSEVISLWESQQKD